MLAVALATLGVVFLALPHVRPQWVDLHRDSRWSVLGTGVGLRLVEVAALLTAAPTFLRALGIHSMADACHRLSSPVPAGSLLGDVFTVASVGLLARTLFVRWRLRSRRSRTRIESTLGVHERYLGHPNTQVVTVPTSAWIAYAAPGSPNQIVISTGVRDKLTDVELAALLEHEVAHLRLRHHRALALLAELDGVAGRWVRGVTDRVRLMIERTADEAASAVQGPGALQGALCAGAGAGPASNVSMEVRRAELGQGTRTIPLLPVALVCTVAVGVLVVSAFSAAAEHGLWGIVGLCGF